MSIRMKTMTFVSALLMLAGSVMAAGLNRTHIPINAKWIVHIDVEVASSTELAELADSLEKDAEAQKKIDEMVEFLGFRPKDNLNSVTLYGVNYIENKGVVIVTGDIPVEHLEAKVEAAKNHEVTSYGSSVIHKWTAEGSKCKDGVACFYGSGVVIMSGSVAEVQAAIDVIAGRTENLSSDADSAVPDVDSSCFLSVYVDNCSAAAKNQQRAAVLMNSKSLTFAVAEEAGVMKAEALLTTASKQNAIQINQVMLGMTALLSLSAPENPELAGLIQGVSVKCVDSSVVVAVSYPSAKLFEAIKKFLAAQQACGNGSAVKGQGRNSKWKSAKKETASQ